MRHRITWYFVKSHTATFLTLTLPVLASGRCCLQRLFPIYFIISEVPNLVGYLAPCRLINFWHLLPIEPMQHDSCKRGFRSLVVPCHQLPWLGSFIWRSDFLQTSMCWAHISAVRQLCSTARQSRSCAGFVLAVRDSFLQGKERSSTATVSSTRIASSLGNISLQVGTTPSSPRVSIVRLIGGLPIYKLWMAAMDGALVLSQMEPALSFTNPLLGMLLRWLLSRLTFVPSSQQDYNTVLRSVMCQDTVLKILLSPIRRCHQASDVIETCEISALLLWAGLQHCPPERHVPRYGAWDFALTNWI